LRCAILAGGEGRRIGGNKPLKLFKGFPLIYLCLSRLLEVFSPPILISVKKKDQAEKIAKTLKKWGIREELFSFVFDEFPEVWGPVSGIFSVLKSLNESEKAVLITAVDQPLINPDYLRYLISLQNIFCNAFLIVARDESKIYPFPGVYPSWLKSLMLDFIKFSVKKSLFRLFMDLKKIGSIFFVKKTEANEENFVNINTERRLKELETCFSQRLRIQNM